MAAENSHNKKIQIILKRFSEYTNNSIFSETDKKISCTDPNCKHPQKTHKIVKIWAEKPSSKYKRKIMEVSEDDEKEKGEKYKYIFLQHGKPQKKFIFQEQIIACIFYEEKVLALTSNFVIIIRENNVSIASLNNIDAFPRNTEEMFNTIDEASINLYGEKLEKIKKDANMKIIDHISKVFGPYVAKLSEKPLKLRCSDCKREHTSIRLWEDSDTNQKLAEIGIPSHNRQFIYEISNSRNNPDAKISVNNFSRNKLFDKNVLGIVDKYYGKKSETYTYVYFSHKDPAKFLLPERIVECIFYDRKAIFLTKTLAIIVEHYFGAIPLQNIDKIFIPNKLLEFIEDNNTPIENIDVRYLR